MIIIFHTIKEHIYLPILKRMLNLGTDYSDSPWTQGRIKIFAAHRLK